ncbi:acetyltransferase [Brachyspira hyodysenteriae]|uniref:acetyltransferase n=1 Tax=Brachyspira hyodysenteriae TaxID=159 RepID=UPI0022CE15C1|nr:acetyltransferase [Brachyspira hyodysenteriae]MDA0058755.1 acetyltransferase [Brachyspira hyodysenteriae]
MKDIIIWGATGQAIVLEEIISDMGLNIVAFFDRNKKVKSPFDNIPIFYNKDNLLAFKNKYFLVAIGGTNGKDRVSISEMLLNLGFKSISIISKNAYISKSSCIMDGVQILPNATIMPRVTIGKYSIINTSASIDHECNIGKGVHIAPNATLSGCIEVGDYSFIGSGATILPRIKIGKNVIVGAGAVVTKDINDNKIVYGIPAKNRTEQNRTEQNSSNIDLYINLLFYKSQAAA